MKRLKKTKSISKNNTTKKYKVVFIDWNGTLSGSKFWGHLEYTNNDLFRKIEDTLFGSLRGLLKPWMKGELKSEDVIRSISDQANIPYTTIFDEFLYSCQHMELVSNEIPLLVREFQKRGSKVVIATDNMDSFTRWTARHMDLYTLYDDILSSNSLHGMKKDVNKDGNSIFFSDYIKRENLKPGDSVLIDDSADDIETIKNFGIDYIQIEPVVGLIPALKKILTPQQPLNI